MRFTRLRIENFRGVRELDLDDLGSMVILAGGNGSGKTAALEALRLLKSLFGGSTQADEWRLWLDEFQISSNGRPFDRLVRDPEQTMLIRATVELASSEVAFLRTNVRELILQRAWERGLGRRTEYSDAETFAERMAELTSDDRASLDNEAEQIQQALDLTSHTLELILEPEDSPRAATSPAIVLHFWASERHPELGVIDYHPANRHYQRSPVNTNVAIRQESAVTGKNYLFNTQAKYQNVKSQLLESYVKELISADAVRHRGDAVEQPAPDSADLNKTMEDLFTTFFVGKTYEGPQPQSDGRVLFNVALGDGYRHDIEDLSSGEKEIVYGYLRLRGENRSSSVILIDEPELHLNPKLVSELPAFYKRYLADTRGNQIWLVTHSDALLRQVVGNGDYSVFHISPAHSVAADQAQKVAVESDSSRLAVELVGDLASYRPSNTTLILEGGGDTEFDARIVRTLFPQVARTCNLVSGGSRISVGQLKQVLSKAGQIDPNMGTFVAIVDRDLGALHGEGSDIYTWDRYHIENYLLEANFLAAAISRFIGSSVDSIEVQRRLACAAERIASDLPRQRVVNHINRDLLSDVRIGGKTEEDLVRSIRSSHLRLEKRLSELNGVPAEHGEPHGMSQLGEMIASARREAQNDLEAGTWTANFPGREILKAFLRESDFGVPYANLCNLTLAEMASAGYEPEGMRNALRAAGVYLPRADSGPPPDHR